MTGTAPFVLTSGQMKDLAAAVVCGIPADLPPDLASFWQASKGEISDRISRLLFGDQLETTGRLIEKWAKFYADIFSISLSRDDLVIPPRNNSALTHGCLIINHGRLTMDRMWDECCRRWCFSELVGNEGSKMPYFYNTRSSLAGHCVWAPNSLASDERYMNAQLLQLCRRGVHGLTLMECLLQELFNSYEQKPPINQHHPIVCLDSATPNHRFPSVWWDKGIKVALVDGNLAQTEIYNRPVVA